ncbi:NAD(P)/FAD-dependent oxidoreductase [Pseudonocardia eucalypti]|uniref:NAD(P)/FAD-dependent oxidoreductase n=1 Tax=Pseudonocardia eucalypti TaxID=648755 RepID=A0ABP9R4U4_9PSEU|nr:cation diffusion facilitator CzcD-associated flavoprotein CzcO [Pseudonocardia eucalypti]
MSVLIIGAGFAGLGTAIRLKQAGIEDFVVLERADRVGGTWRDNTYPGAACDIPSLLYSYSFAPNPDWSRAYSGSAEIQAYIEDVVREHNLQTHLRFGADVTGLAFDEDTARWTAHTSAGDTYTARHAVLAAGALANASLPDIRGMADYTGKIMHSARWDHDYDFTGKTVAVVGTGASAVQIIPELVKTAGKVKVFQRTPGWVLPRLDFAHPSWAKSLFRDRPETQAAARGAWFWGHEAVALGLVWNSLATGLVQTAAKRHLRTQVKDRWLRRQLTPDFRAGCKRMLVSSDYYPALQADNCKLITWPIARLSADGIRTAEGIEHRADAIVFATGFQVNKTGTPFPVTGPGGRDLAREWAGGAQAYKSVSVAGYPNLFLTFGPNSGPGHNSALFYLEAQIDYLVRAIRLCRERRIRTLDVRPAVQRVYNESLQRRLAGTTWNSGCRSWYLTADGFNATMFPGFATQYRRQLADLDLADYTATPVTASEPALRGRSPAR